MMVYERIYKALDGLLPGGVEGFASNSEGYVKLEAGGFMPLSIDLLSVTETEHGKTIVISMAHNFIQNGDVMADPDMEIRIFTGHKMAEAMTFQQDSLSIYNQVYQTIDRREMVNTRLKTELNSFLATWLRNIKSQGHK